MRRYFNRTADRQKNTETPKKITYKKSDRIFRPSKSKGRRKEFTWWNIYLFPLGSRAFKLEPLNYLGRLPHRRNPARVLSFPIFEDPSGQILVANTGDNKANLKRLNFKFNLRATLISRLIHETSKVTTTELIDGLMFKKRRWLISIKTSCLRDRIAMCAGQDLMHKSLFWDNERRSISLKKVNRVLKCYPRDEILTNSTKVNTWIRSRTTL